jgi:chaperonin GroEL
MCDNSGFEKDEMIKRLGTLETNRDGIDFNNGELINLAESGIVDPAKVARCALQNAASVASVLITTNFSIIK